MWPSHLGSSLHGCETGFLFFHKKHHRRSFPLLYSFLKTSKMLVLFGSRFRCDTRHFPYIWKLASWWLSFIMHPNYSSDKKWNTWWISNVVLYLDGMHCIGLFSCGVNDGQPTDQWGNVIPLYTISASINYLHVMLLIIIAYELFSKAIYHFESGHMWHCHMAGYIWAI